MKNIFEKTEGKLMLKWAKILFPICRSLTGKGTQKTLRFFKN